VTLALAVDPAVIVLGGGTLGASLLALQRFTGDTVLPAVTGGAG